MHPSRRLPFRRACVAVAAVAALLLTAPAAAQGGDDTGPTRIFDPALGANVILVGPDASTGRESVAQPISNVFIVGCAATPDARGGFFYLATRYTATATGYVRDTASYADAACSVPLTAP